MGTRLKIDAKKQSDYTQFYEYPITVPKGSLIALESANFWYSWHNIYF